MTITWINLMCGSSIDQIISHKCLASQVYL